VTTKSRDHAPLELGLTSLTFGFFGSLTAFAFFFGSSRGRFFVGVTRGLFSFCPMFAFGFDFFVVYLGLFL
jgi:hypothetical protein